VKQGINDDDIRRQANALVMAMARGVGVENSNATKKNSKQRGFRARVLEPRGIDLGMSFIQVHPL
jgi:hypothetical protein